MLAIAIIVVFAAYTFILRGRHSSTVIAPPNVSTSSTAGSSTSTSSGSTSSGSSSGTTSSSSTTYKDGTFTGSVANAYYGNVQVQVTISGGKITNVAFLSYPSDNPNSQSINQQATPYLKQEAIQTQNANVNIISGATLTSNAFVQSMSSALNQAKA